MIDFHSHLLPGIDDGSKSIEQSIKMLNQYVSNNIDTVIVTPHFNMGMSLDEFLENREHSYNLIKDFALARSIKLVKGAEVGLTSELVEHEELEKLCIENTEYILIELPYNKTWFPWVYMSLFEMITKRNLKPVIAHVDRYMQILDDVHCIDKLMNMDVLGQINTSAVNNLFCRAHCKHLISKGYVHVIGCDSHDDTFRKPDLLSAVNRLDKKYGPDFALTLNNNAVKILNNEKIEDII